MRRLIAAAGVALLGASAVASCTAATALLGGRATDPATAGGTLTLLSSTTATLDPQRVGDPAQAALLGRTLHRTLTAYAPLKDGATQAELVGDLAEKTGEPSQDLKSWTFTLREGVTWQDGTPVTCDDVRHGASRTFATDAITGGSTDALASLAISRTPDGRSIHKGPWAQGPEADAGRAAFDQAVTCDGRTVTFRLSEPTADFNEMVTLQAFAPVKKDGDTGPDSGAVSISNGPYQVEGTWNPEQGGTLVRNAKWSASSDAIRKAFPDRMLVMAGQESGATAEAVLSDRDPYRAAVSLTSAPAALQQQVMAIEDLERRSLSVPTGVVDYLVPSTSSAVFAKKEARSALAASTNRAGYAAGLATPEAVRPHGSVIPGQMLARATADVPAAGPDAEKSKELLAAAGLTTPVPIKVAYRPGAAADKGMAALVAGWRAGGFEPTLVPIKDAYFATISAGGAATQYDVFWSNWSPAWGSASTILPPLFDSTVNITAAGNGRDYGGWSNADWNTRIREVSLVPDRAAREKAWTEADDVLRDDVAYVALVERSALHLAGSQVRGLIAQPLSGGAIDLAVAGVDS